jgi:hypothetical protein
LDPVEGDTIKPLFNYWGRRPEPPDPAYQQWLHGVPAVDFTTEELLYLPQNVRSNRIYGYPRVEQIIITINTAIRRSLHQLEYYVSGSVPEAFLGLPKEWDLKTIKDFQSYMDTLLSGQLSQRRKLRMVPGEFKYQEAKPYDLKEQYDEWLARIICFAFSIDPTPFIQHVSRTGAQTTRSRALEEGLTPTQRWMKVIIDRILEEDFQSPDLEFVYLEEREQDPSAQANIDVVYAKAGIKSIDEIRQARGFEPMGDMYSKPMYATAQGYIIPGQLTSQFGRQTTDNSLTGAGEGPREDQDQGVHASVGQRVPGEHAPPERHGSEVPVE